MPVVAQCGQCGKQYRVDAKFAGKKAACKNCGAVITVPASSMTKLSVGSRAPTPSAAADRRSAEPDDPFAAMDELERTGRVGEDQGYAVAELPAAAPSGGATGLSQGKYVLRAMPPPPKKSGNEVGLSTLWFVIGPPGVALIIFGVVLMVALIGLSSAKAAASVAAPVAVGGFAFSIIGGIWCRRTARENGFTFLHALIPGYNIFFAIQNWEAMANPVYCWARGLLLITLASAVYGRAGMPVPWRRHTPQIVPFARVFESPPAPNADVADDADGAADSIDADSPKPASATTAPTPHRPDQEAMWPSQLAPFPAPESRILDQLERPAGLFSMPYEIRSPKGWSSNGFAAAIRQGGGGVIAWEKPGASVDGGPVPSLNYSVGPRYRKLHNRPRVFIHLNSKSRLFQQADELFEGAQVDFGTLDGIEFVRAIAKGDKELAPSLTYLAFDGNTEIRITAYNVVPGMPEYQLLDSCCRSFRRTGGGAAAPGDRAE